MGQHAAKLVFSPDHPVRSRSAQTAELDVLAEVTSEVPAEVVIARSSGGLGRRWLSCLGGFGLTASAKCIAEEAAEHHAARNAHRGLGRAGQEAAAPGLGRPCRAH